VWHALAADLFKELTKNSTKVLGVTWKPDDDALNPAANATTSKRQFPPNVSHIVNTMGLLAPTVVTTHFTTYC